MFYLLIGRYHKPHCDSAHLNGFIDETAEGHWMFYERNGYKNRRLRQMF